MSDELKDEKIGEETTSEDTSTQEETDEETESTDTSEEEEVEEEEDEEEEPRRTSNPDVEHRIQALTAEKRQLESMVNRLLESQPRDVHDPNIDPDDPDAVQRAREKQEFRNALGHVMDQMDALEIRTSPVLDSLYKENRSEVEEYREMKARQGIYVKREEALAIVRARRGETLSTKSSKKGKKKPTVKRQKVQPLGETRKAVKKSTDAPKKSLEERLSGVKF